MRRTMRLLLVVVTAGLAGACGSGPSDPNMPGDMMPPDMLAASPAADSSAGVVR